MNSLGQSGLSHKFAAIEPFLLKFDSLRFAAKLCTEQDGLEAWVPKQIAELP